MEPNRWINYPDFRQTPVVGQRVQVYRNGLGGTRFTNQTVTKVTATQVTLDDGNRYKVLTGEQVGAFSKCETRPRITKVLA